MTYLLRRKGLGKTPCSGIANASNFDIRVVVNNPALLALEDDGNELCIRWGCTSFVLSTNILNKANAIYWASDKSGSRKTLQEYDPTLVPRTWFSSLLVTYPCIIRPHTHAQGKNLWFCKNKYDLTTAISLAGPNWYASEFIDKVKEYRVFVVSNRVVCVAEKTPGDPTAIAWNVAQGGKFSNVKWSEWPLEAIGKALKAMDFSGLDFGGVDVIVDKEGKSYILEINSACSLTSPYRQQCFAKAFDYIIENGKDKFPIPDKISHWKDVIHIAL